MVAQTASQFYLRIQGLHNKYNYIYYSRADPSKSLEGEDVDIPIKNVIFFSGDLQMMRDDMLYGSQLQLQYANDYCIEKTCSKMQKKWPHANIICVLPVKYAKQGQAIYNNFVNCYANGLPTTDRDTEGNGLKHLSSLMKNLFKSLKTQGLSNREIDGICITGFSKGCIVLNQFLYDFLAWPECDLNINKMIWIDGGYLGGIETWITNPAVLQSYINKNIVTEVHVTPWQIGNEMKELVKTEEQTFSETLENNTETFSRYYHFSNEAPSLDRHFAALDKI